MDASKRKVKSAAVSLVILVCIGCLAIHSRYDSFAGKPSKVVSGINRQTEDSRNDAAMKSKNIPMRRHTVLQGETLTAIAEQYNIDVDTLYGANSDIQDIIYPGQELAILPEKGILYVIKKGDTLWSIARTFHVPMQTIMTANHKVTNNIYEGDKLFLPGAKYERDVVVSRSSVVRFLWPTVGELSSPFGYRWGRLHAGIDIANDSGTPIRAARSGQVVFAGWETGYGYMVMMDHGSGYATIYGHLSDYCVTKGAHINTGQVIGYMGNTGNSTGPHLHFEVRHNGNPMNPYLFLP